LRFDGAEVLHVPPDAAPGVLPEPVQQRREVDRVPRRPAVVVAPRVERRAVAVDPAVGVQGEGQERRRAVAAAEHLTDRASLDWPAREVRGVLPTTSRPPLLRFRWWVERGQPAPNAGGADRVVQLADRLGDLLAPLLLAEGLALGVRGEQVRPRGE